MSQTIFVAIVIRDYANYRGDPEAAFTTEEKAIKYQKKSCLGTDIKIFEVPLNPGDADGN